MAHTPEVTNTPADYGRFHQEVSEVVSRAGTRAMDTLKAELLDMPESADYSDIASSERPFSYPTGRALRHALAREINYYVPDTEEMGYDWTPSYEIGGWRGGSSRIVHGHLHGNNMFAFRQTTAEITELEPHTTLPLWRSIGVRLLAANGRSEDYQLFSGFDIPPLLVREQALATLTVPITSDLLKRVSRSNTASHQRALCHLLNSNEMEVVRAGWKEAQEDIDVQDIAQRGLRILLSEQSTSANTQREQLILQAYLQRKRENAC